MSRTMIVALILALLTTLIACSKSQENGPEGAKESIEEIQEGYNEEAKDLEEKEMPEGPGEQLEESGTSAAGEMASTTDKLGEDARKELQEKNIPYSAIEFVRCAREGKAQEVNIFLSAGIETDIRVGEFGLTALMEAARNGHSEVVQGLLAKGADVNAAADMTDLTPLMMAAKGGHAETTKILLDAGANPDALSRHGSTALMWAAAGGHGDIVKILLARDANINIANVAGKTALILAEENAHKEIVEMLEEVGVEERVKP